MTVVATPIVRIAMTSAAATAMSSRLLDAPAAVSEQLYRQLWLRTVLLEQRRRTHRPERQAFDRQADEILQQLDPVDAIASRTPEP